MHRMMRRATRSAILLSIVAVGLPAFVVFYVLATRDDLLRLWMDQAATTRALLVGAAYVLLVAIGAVVSMVVARRATDQVVESMHRLTESAERFGAGEGHLAPLDSGIDEIDRISEVLSRSAQQMNRALATERGFASDASHQLRTPLTALLMRIEEIAVTDDLQVAHEEAAVALGQVERLSRVVDDLLERRRQTPEATLPQVPLDTVIASLQREWQPAFETARRSVRVHGERGLVVRATPVALSQVLSTLLENSLVHGRGTVDVHARRSGPSVVVEVTDEGDGVPAALAPHIFERSVSSRQGTSSGLGLALARDLAESCGGRLDLIARQPATFALFLSEAAVPPGAVRS